MKRLSVILFLLFFVSAGFGQVKISAMPTTSTNPTGGWIPIVLNGTNQKIDAGIFYNKIDSLYRKAGTDSLFFIKNGISTFSFVDSTGSCCADTPYIPQRTMAQLRANATAAFENKVYYIIDQDKQGFFRYDLNDNTTPDDSVMTLVSNNQRFKRILDDHINIKWFGATGNGSSDDWYAIQKAVNYAIANPAVPRTIYFPQGSYNISQPIILSNYMTSDNDYHFFDINLKGATPSKAADGHYTSQINPTFNDRFAIGLQRARTCIIENLAIRGKFTFPNTLTPLQVCTKKYSEWTDGSTRDNQYSPYAGIVVDPFCPSTQISLSDEYPGLSSYYHPSGSQGGTSGIQIKQCSIANFIIGVMVTPNPYSQNADVSDIIDCDIESNKIAIAFGQDQTKENHVIRLKCWSATHTIYDGLHYGRGISSAPYIDGMNIAGSVNQLIYADLSRFPAYIMNVYSESLFKLGYLPGSAGAHFINCQIDFINSAAGFPAPDYYIAGNNISFDGCMFRLYTGSVGYRLKFSGTNAHFENGVTNEPPIAVGLFNGISPTPSFDNVGMYYLGIHNGSSAVIGRHGINNAKFSEIYSDDVVYPGTTYEWQDAFYLPKYRVAHRNGYERLASLGTATVTVDQATWTASFTVSSAVLNYIKVNDYIVSGDGLPYYDQALNNNMDPTVVIGRIKAINGTVVTLDQVQINVPVSHTFNISLDYYVLNKGVITGDFTSGSNVITNVQSKGYLYVGDRLDMPNGNNGLPIIPNGAYVTAIGTNTITLSVASSITQHDATIVNGNPAITMLSLVPPDQQQQQNADLYGGADFYLSADGQYGAYQDHYRILNTNLNGNVSLHPLKFLAVSTAYGGNSVAVGNTSQRASVPGKGLLRFNTDIGGFEGNDGTTWKSIAWKGENVMPVSTQNYTALSTDNNIIYSYAGSGGTITLPAPSTTGGTVFFINNSSASSVTLSSNSVTISTLNAGKWVKIVASAPANAWYIVAGN